jgi:hypothetical protein
MEKIIKAFLVQVEHSLSESKARESMYKKTAHDIKRQNEQLLKRIEILNARPEVNDTELYLVNKLEILEQEVVRKDNLIRSLQHEKSR